MKNNNCLLFFNLVLLTIQLYAQDPYPQAPEVWSEPKKIISLSLNGYYTDMPSITPDGKKIFYYTSLPDSPGVIYYSEKIDTGWSKPKKLNSYVNATILDDNPSISPDGRKLYFIRYDYGGYGDWDLWVSEWSDSLNDWGPSRNLGPNINTDAIEWVCYTPDNKYLYFTRVSGFLTDIMISKWNDTAKQWGPSTLFDNHKLNIGHDIDGITMAQNKKKLYLGMFNFSNSNYKHDEFDIYVSYFDSTKRFYGTPMLLNINSHPDTSVPEYNPWSLGYDGYPTITADGKHLFFSSNRNDTNHIHGGRPFFDIYESRLLVDENGDTVTNVKEETNPIKSIRLYQNYPNPFNPTTVINYQIPNDGFVTLKVYDILGKEVKTLVNEFQAKGKYSLNFDASRLASGIYFYQMRAGNFSSTKKMILTK